MNKALLALSIMALNVSASAIAESLPDQYSYQLAIYKSGKEVYKHTNMTTGTNLFSDKSATAFLIKTCEKKGNKNISSTGGKKFYEGFGYQINVQDASLTIFETVINSDSYKLPKKDEMDKCLNTGEPVQKEYRYDVNFDLTNKDIQQFDLGQGRNVKLIVQKQD